MHRTEIKSRVKDLFRRMTRYNMVFGNNNAAAQPHEALLLVRHEMTQINIGESKMESLVDGLCTLQDIVLNRSSHDYDFTVLTHRDFNHISNYKPFFEGIINIIFPGITILWREDIMAGSFTVHGYNGSVQYRDSTAGNREGFDIRVELQEDSVARDLHSNIRILLHSMNYRLNKLET